MNQKASMILMIIFELVAVILVISMTVGIARHYTSSLLTFKTNTAEDMRMMVNTLVDVPGDALVRYPHDVSAFSFILNSNSVEVFEEGQPDYMWVVRGFFLPEGYLARGVVKNTPDVCLEKKEKVITILTCPST